MVQLSRRPPVNSPWHPGACGGCNAVVQTGGTLSALEADEDGWTARIQQLCLFFFLLPSRTPFFLSMLLFILLFFLFQRAAGNASRVLSRWKGDRKGPL